MLERRLDEWCVSVAVGFHEGSHDRLAGIGDTIGQAGAAVGEAISP